MNSVSHEKPKTRTRAKARRFTRVRGGRMCVLAMITVSVRCMVKITACLSSDMNHSVLCKKHVHTRKLVDNTRQTGSHPMIPQRSGRFLSMTTLTARAVPKHLGILSRCLLTHARATRMAKSPSSPAKNRALFWKTSTPTMLAKYLTVVSPSSTMG